MCYPAFWQGRDTKKLTGKLKTVRRESLLYTVLLWISMNFVRVRIEPKLIGHEKLSHESQRFKSQVNPSPFVQVMINAR